MRLLNVLRDLFLSSVYLAVAIEECVRCAIVNCFLQLNSYAVAHAVQCIVVISHLHSHIIYLVCLVLQFVLNSLSPFAQIINLFISGALYASFFFWFHQQNHLIALVITVPLFMHMHIFIWKFSSFAFLFFVCFHSFCSASIVVIAVMTKGKRYMFRLFQLIECYDKFIFTGWLCTILWRFMSTCLYICSGMMMKYHVTTTKIISFVRCPTESRRIIFF